MQAHDASPERLPRIPDTLLRAAETHALTVGGGPLTRPQIGMRARALAGMSRRSVCDGDGTGAIARGGGLHAPYRMLSGENISPLSAFGQMRARRNGRVPNRRLVPQADPLANSAAPPQLSLDASDAHMGHHAVIETDTAASAAAREAEAPPFIASDSNTRR